MKNQNNTSQFGLWLRVPFPPRRAERNQGAAPMYYGRKFPEHTALEGHPRRGPGGRRHGDERNQARSFSGEGEEEEFQERFKSPLRQEDRGYCARNNNEEFPT